MRVRVSFALLFGLPALLLAGSCGNSETHDRNDGDGSNGGRGGASGESGESGTAGASGTSAAGVGGTTGGRGGSSGAGGDAGGGAGGESVGGNSGEGSSAGEAGGGDGGSSAGETGGGNGGSSAGKAGAGGAGGDSCPRVVATTRRPSAVVIMFDRSGSMIDSQIPTRWDQATFGLRDFLSTSASVGFGVGLRMYPHDVPAVGCASPACNAAACAELLYPITSLTASEVTAISGLVANYPPSLTGPSGGTPTSVAVEGAVVAAEAYATAHPLTKMGVVFVTDGEPNGCNENVAQIATTVGGALSRSGIRTYAIGISDSSLPFLNQLASAGGTGEALLVRDGSTQAANFSFALQSIRDSLVACELPVSISWSQGPVDPALVLVMLTTTSGSTTLARVASAAACGTVPSYYYDAPLNPGSIILCPSSCRLVQGGPGANLEVIVGCPTR